MFTPRYVKHSKLLVRHAEKYLRYKRDLLSDEKREDLRASVKSLATALREKKADRIRAGAEALDGKLHTVEVRMRAESGDLFCKHEF